MSFLDWLEQRLGPMAEGKDTELVAGSARVFVCRFPDQPVEGATTYCTDAYDGEEGHPPVELTWLVPLTPDEAAFARARDDRGPMVDLLAERDPDLLDWTRPSMLTDAERAEG